MIVKLSVIGLGKLGACSAACFAARGFQTLGVDTNARNVDRINEGMAPVQEPRLQELMEVSRGKLRATRDYGEAIEQSDITFLIVPTPSQSDGHFSDLHLQEALRPLAQALKRSKKKFHNFVITSTISPGTTDERLTPLIESISERKVNQGFGICYNPEFIALGSVITNFLNPDMVLIGESNAQAGEQLVRVYEKVCENKPYVARMSIVSAEIAKISLNSFVTMKLSFANTLANICECVPNSDVDAISKALGADKRISSFYLKGGLGYGGPCFPRDNRAFAAFLGKYGCDATLAKATDQVNQAQAVHIVKKVLAHISADQKASVGILGLAYKPNTPVIEESPAIQLIEELLKKNLRLTVYDPVAMDNVRTQFGDKIQYAISAKHCLEQSSLCVVTTQAEEFKTIDESDIRHSPTTIIDCWRMLDPKRFGANVKYVAIGRNAK